MCVWLFRDLVSQLQWELLGTHKPQKSSGCTVYDLFKGSYFIQIKLNITLKEHNQHKINNKNYNFADEVVTEVTLPCA